MLADRRRVLIAVNKTHEGEMKSLFERDILSTWQPLYADGFSRARFTLQHNPCEALIVHESLLEAEGSQGLAWLAWKKEYPTVFLGQSPHNFQRAYDVGVQHCLAYDMALSHAPLLATVLRHAQAGLEANRSLTKAREQLSHTRRHIDRLVTMLWRTAPHQDDAQWYSEPFMLERLDEEIARAERHKLPLSVAVGELAENETTPILPDGTPELLIKGKRRCDVVGQYGPRGFLLLMVHTPKSGGITCCKRLQHVLEHKEEELQTPHHRLRAFFGLSTTHGDRMSPQSLLRSAEQNLDAARRDPSLGIVAD